MAASETLTRVGVALAGIPVVIAAAYFGEWVLAALLAAIAALTARELFRMAARKAPRPLELLGMMGAAGMILGAAIDPRMGLANPVPAAVLVVLTMTVATAAIWTRGVEGEPFLSLAITVFGAGYAGLLAFGLFLRHLPGVDDPLHGTAILFAPILLTWVSDTAAYFGGRAMGKHKLIPRVSPGKTVEGALSAVAGSLLAGAGYAVLLGRFPAYHPTILQGAVFGLLVSVFAQVGDLAESLLKRDVGVKDSGTLLPGHGGALDRFDSLLFTLPLGYAFFRFVVGG
ncbi:phosphatidate cytidylyltransferase [Longimicrobium terrae]|uniref:Phosphatidate cytidylyltransferase n=1 Tax=Longimicrobium terrae TaxID=1639882 RepID=A0A841GMX3_9BACT|nr:phosphatidate cytidylyltransferase [Longimicrobium terrae]MBB6070151.1 phosphatidate cytidylyltransferase [Longimicrobium terrae]NNC33052.1 phosphatidate cytidylyltransferase [Longimicrobium terrae]